MDLSLGDILWAIVSLGFVWVLFDWVDEIKRK